MGHIAKFNIMLSSGNYLINEKSKEIHDLNNIHQQCFIDIIKNKTYIKGSQLPEYIKNGYNGCRWCNSKYDTD